MSMYALVALSGDQTSFISCLLVLVVRVSVGWSVEWGIGGVCFIYG